MDHETKTEIVIFSGLAAFMAYLWYANHQAGAGTGLSDAPFIDLASGSGGAGSLPGAPSFAPVDPVAAITPGPLGNSVFNIAAPNLAAPSAATGAGCGCGGPATALQFGSPQTLVSYLYPPPAPVAYPDYAPQQAASGIVYPTDADVSTAFNGSNGRALSWGQASSASGLPQLSNWD